MVSGAGSVHVELRSFPPASTMVKVMSQRASLDKAKAPCVLSGAKTPNDHTLLFMVFMTLALPIGQGCDPPHSYSMVNVEPIGSALTFKSTSTS